MKDVVISAWIAGAKDLEFTENDKSKVVLLISAAGN